MSELERRLLANLTSNREMVTAWELGLRSVHFTELVCKAMFDFMVDYWHTEQQRMMPTLAVLTKQFPGIELPIDEDLSTTWATEQLKTTSLTPRSRKRCWKAPRSRMLTHRRRCAFCAVNSTPWPRMSRPDIADLIWRSTSSSGAPAT